MLLKYPQRLKMQILRDILLKISSETTSSGNGSKSILTLSISTSTQSGNGFKLSLTTPSGYGFNLSFLNHHTQVVMDSTYPSLTTTHKWLWIQNTNLPNKSTLTMGILGFLRVLRFPIFLSTNISYENIQFYFFISLCLCLLVISCDIFSEYTSKI